MKRFEACAASSESPDIPGITGGHFLQYVADKLQSTAVNFMPPLTTVGGEHWSAVRPLSVNMYRVAQKVSC